ncbi:hypothetical protein Gotri_005922 [Gossypium trilobum]|uniref:RNase H type-1 domain-containing protein n=1 Tax=Gossypium trilobum TaxID=34281 RepID=A0A7J9EY74_9ROSI|nr:hypothetical protein [Gossypium trilobum]
MKRGIGQDGFYGLCGHAAEDILHVIRDCPIAKEIWSRIIPVVKLNAFFSGGTCTILDTELWGILQGLEIALDRGFDNMFILSDNMETVQAIQVLQMPRFSHWLREANIS